LIFDALAEETPMTIPELADRFGVDDMLYAAKDTGFVALPLYYFGILTFGRVTPFGRSELRIPNLVIRRLYAESIQKMLLPEGREGDQVRRAAESLYQQGDIGPLCDFMEQKYFKVFSNRDYAHANELTIVQSKQREAEAGLMLYRARLKTKFGDLSRLHSFSVVAVGFERLVFSLC